MADVGDGEIFDSLFDDLSRRSMRIRIIVQGVFAVLFKQGLFYGELWHTHRLIAVASRLHDVAAGHVGGSRLAGFSQSALSRLDNPLLLKSGILRIHVH